MKNFTFKHNSLPIPKPSSIRARNTMRSNVSKNTKPELLLRSSLYKKGFRYRIHYPMFGKPDIVFVSRKIAIFVDGCFWHKCPKCYVEPKTNVSYWRKKILGNVDRAINVNEKLRVSGWTVLRIWEHEILTNLEVAVDRISQIIQSKSVSVN